MNRKKEIREIILWCIEKGYTYEDATSMVENTYSKRKMKAFALLWKELNNINEQPSSIYQSYSREQIDEKIKSGDNILNYGAMFTGLAAAVFVIIAALLRPDGTVQSFSEIPYSGIITIFSGIICVVGAIFAIYKPLLSSIILFISTFLIILSGFISVYGGLMFIGLISALSGILSLFAWRK